MIGPKVSIIHRFHCFIFGLMESYTTKVLLMVPTIVDPRIVLGGRYCNENYEIVRLPALGNLSDGSIPDLIRSHFLACDGRRGYESI